MADRLKWGILGTGNIANQFSAGVNACLRGTLVAVASRHPQKARDFAAKHHIPASHGTYEDLLRDPHVQAVYVSLPNSMHHQWTIASLQAGKHVLCEKPFALNSAQSQEMFDQADKSGLKLMEAFMYRCHPQTHAVLQELRSGTIGQLKLIRTSFCYFTARVQGNIRFSADLGGGALMDVGCYCIDLAQLLADSQPTQIHLTAHLHESGVDELAAGTLRFANGVISTFTCGMRVQADNTAYLCGSEGYIEIPWPWKPTPDNSLYILARSTPPRLDRTPQTAPPTQPRQTRKIDAPLNIYAYQADDFAASVLDGQEIRVTKSQTLANMRILETMRRQIGLSF
jgi:predicted dehydrogenase